MSRADIGNYLETGNAANHPYVSGVADLVSAAETPTFNDLLYCVDAALNVAPC